MITLRNVLLFVLPLFCCSLCLGQQGNFPTGSSSGSGNGVGNGAAPVMGIYFTPSCPVTDPDAVCINTPGNTKQVTGCAWTNASTTVACASGTFTSTDVGKTVMGGQTCASDQTSTVSNAGLISVNANLTIATFVDSAHVTLSGTPTNTATASATYPTGACFIFGNLDDTAASTFDTLLTTLNNCPKIFFAATGYFFNTPHFFTNPPGCISIGPGVAGSGAGNFGNTTLPAGIEYEGRGTANTAWFLTPAFPGGDACTHTTGGAVTQAHGGSCFVIPVMGGWNNFRIDGGAQAGTSNLNNKTLVYAAVGKLDHILINNYGGYTGSSVCLETSILDRLFTVNLSGCGNIGWWADTGLGLTQGQFVVVENSSANDLFIAGPAGNGTNYNVLCQACIFAVSQVPLTGFGSIRNAGGYLRLIGGLLDPTNAVTAIGNTINGYSCTVAGGIAWIDQMNSAYALDSGGSHTNGTIVNTAACTTYVRDSALQAQSAGNTYKGVAGDVLVDLGGNTGWTNGGGVSLNGGQLTGAGNSANNVAVTAAKLVLSAGWGASAAVTSLTGGDFPIQFTITNTGAGQAASPTITYTFPTPLPVAPLACTATDTAGTNPLLNPFTTSSLTATGAVFTATGTPTVSDTEVMQITCVTP